MTPDVEDLRYQHLYHPIDIHEKCPALAHVLDNISAGLFGDEEVYEP
jgi:starch phosphorylase